MRYRDAATFGTAVAADDSEREWTTALSRLDPSGMHRHIAALPSQARDAWQAGLEFELPRWFRRPNEIVMCGVGGSAIGADVLAALAYERRTVPITLVGDYLPPPLNADALAIACSFSGDTEEVVTSFGATLESPGMRLAITTGGQLGMLATSAGIPSFTYRWPGPPRTALGYALFPALAVLSRLDALDMPRTDVEQTIAALRADATSLAPEAAEERNEAKRLARRIHASTPVILASALLAPAARRWAAQLAENAKQWSAVQLLPEFNHNAIVPLMQRPESHRNTLLLILDTAFAHPRNRLRAEQTAAMADAVGLDCEVVNIDAESPFEAIVRACYLGDWTSLYVAMMNGVDPSIIEPIDRLKRSLRFVSDERWYGSPNRGSI